MQTKDILKQPLTTKWVVVNSSSHVSKSVKADPWWEKADGTREPKVAWHNVREVTLHSYDTYAESHYREIDPDHHGFVKTTDDRTKRFLVSDGLIYSVVPASDFLGIWDEFEPYYTAQRELYAEQQKIEQERTRIREGAEAQAKVLIETTKDSITESLKQLVGFQALASTEVSLTSRGTWGESDIYVSNVEGHVRMDYRHFQRLLELAFEGKQ